MQKVEAPRPLDRRLRTLRRRQCKHSRKQKGSKNRKKSAMRLARHIADSGWGAFRRILAYKCVWYGSRLVVANRYYPSSKTCSVCGYVVEQTPLNLREWHCPNCDSHHDRDANAARNLLALAS